jgi:histidine triad (HIT) family protein
VGDCLFCGIIQGEVKGDLVYQDPSVIAFRDIRPQAPVHILIVPRKHVATLLDLGEEDNDLVGHIFQVASGLAKKEGVSKDGFRIVVNCGAGAGQSVYHIHFHLLGGRDLTWPPG